MNLPALQKLDSMLLVGDLITSCLSGAYIMVHVPELYVIFFHYREHWIRW